MKKTAVLTLGLALLMAACAPRQAAQIVDRKVITQAEKDEQIGGKLIRKVKRGDTLYGIAFMAGLDIHQLAAWNGITDKSRLKVGQTIRLTKPVNFVDPTKTTVAKTTEKRVVKSKPSVVRNQPVATTPTSNSGNRASVKDSQSKDAAKANTRPSISNPSKKAETSASIAKPSRSAEQNPTWQWPFRGTIVARFNPAKGEQGVRIQGQSGQAVLAAQAGEVVYAGDSLKGYGNLVIVKHADEFLSAYAHNSKILVQEGQRVRQGAVIASLTTSPLKKAVAQFQIRLNGNPVDPLKYLP